MKKISLTIIICFLLSDLLYSQVTVTKGDNSLDISGRISTYYNHRFYDADEVDRRKNRFVLKDVRLSLEGDNGNDLEFKIQLDLSALLAGAADVESAPMKDAYVMYSGLNIFDILVGYTKVPYSFSSQMSFSRMAFMQRAEMLRGEAFSRRDIGVMLHKSLWDRKIDIYTGVYTGMGEISLLGDNDPSGNPEFIGRFELAYPIRYRYRELDLENTQKLSFTGGVNARYAKKSLTTNMNYELFTVDGERLLYGADVSLRYKGFSAQFEAHQMKVTPNDVERLYNYDTEFFRAGGFLAQLNYVIFSINSALSVRYDEFNPHDLIEGNTRRNLSLGYNYFFDEQNSYIKVHYFHRLDKDATGEPWNENQIRIGYVYSFF